MRPLSLLILPGCFLGGSTPTPTPVSETDTDTDTDTDADTDADADTDTEVDDSWYVYKSAGVYTGNLAGAAASNDGLAGADSLCNQTARDEGFVGTYQAWLSSSTTHAIDRVPATGGPWILVDGEVAFATPGDFGGVPENDVVVDQFEEPHFGRIWTGTDATGHSTGFNCDDWTSNDGDGTIGTGEGEEWTASSDTICSSGRSLVCFRTR